MSHDFLSSILSVVRCHVAWGWFTFIWYPIMLCFSALIWHHDNQSAHSPMINKLHSSSESFLQTVIIIYCPQRSDLWPWQSYLFLLLVTVGGIWWEQTNKQPVKIFSFQNSFSHLNKSVFHIKHGHVLTFLSHTDEQAFNFLNIKTRLSNIFSLFVTYFINDFFLLHNCQT